MTQELLMWMLIPFSLKGEAKQWSANVVESADGDWDELKDKFYLAFFPMSRIASLPMAILDFKQNEKESISAAWARFSMLIPADPYLSLPNSVLLHLFCSGLDKEAALCLDMTVEGHFHIKLRRNRGKSLITS